MSVDRMKLNEKKAVFFFCLFAVLFLHSIVSEAQVRRNKQPFYKGFDVSFGVKTFELKSNIAEIDGLNVAEEGGSAGVVFGSKLFRTTASAGFYYSASSVKQTVDMFQGRVVMNFYPLSLITKRQFKLEPYVVGGINFDKYKFAGKYLMDDQAAYYAGNNDVYIGFIKQFNLSKGFGLEYQLKDKFDFLHVYSEVQFGTKLSSQATSSAFSSTSVSDNMIVSIGLRFGAFR